jgi:hypothetical protein
MCSRKTSRTLQADLKSSSRQDPFQATPPDSFGLEPNTEAIGIAGQRGKWKDGCVRPSSNTSKALPKKSSCRRPLKARDVLLASTIPAPVVTMLCDTLLRGAKFGILWPPAAVTCPSAALLIASDSMCRLPFFRRCAFGPFDERRKQINWNRQKGRGVMLARNFLHRL